MTTRTSLRSGARYFAKVLFIKKNLRIFPSPQAYIEEKARNFSSSRGFRNLGMSLDLYYHIVPHISSYLSQIFSYFSYIPPRNLSKYQDLYVGESSKFSHVQSLYIGRSPEFFQVPGSIYKTEFGILSPRYV